ncbi:FAD-binding oxidoreductase [Streptomyces sp. NPDC057582]|uniref:FAD-binding oxidoreductase n=1 Tax=Streptomyces sp. NPDC057582 TaxID=3346174 RepID=UPI00368AEECB
MADDSTSPSAARPVTESVTESAAAFHRDRDDAPGPAHAPARVRPEGLAEAAAALEAAAEARQSLLFKGAGTALSWGAPPTSTDLVVDTTGMDRPVGHAAEDWTVTVQAGMPLTRLQELLAPAGQWFPVDPPTASAGATIGGLLAAADDGPLRLAVGNLSGLVIGATLVLADGTVARSGGQVIKNVAGYDLAKLFAGSLGAFGLIAELTLRVHPLPAATATLALAADDAERALAAARTVVRSPLEPVAVEWDGEQLLVRFHGTADGTETRVRLATGIPALTGARVLDPDDAQAAWARVGALALGAEGDTVLRAGTRPAHLPALARALRDAARRTGVDATLLSSVAVGVHTVRLRGGDSAAHAACLTAWREAVHALGDGGTVTLRRRRDGVAGLAEPWGPAPATAPLLCALKRQFDPHDRCAPGRFAPWF